MHAIWLVGLIAGALGGGTQDGGASGTPSDPVPPVSLTQEEPQPPPQEEPVSPRPLLQGDEGSPWIDFDWLEFQPRVGLAIFSEDYHIDPSPYFSLLARAPMPWLSPGSDPGGEYFGVFAEIGFLPSVTRDISPEPENPSGSILLANFGFDFTFVRNQSLFLGVQVGAQYASYGGITDLSSGFGTMAGINAGMYLGSGLTLTLAPEVAFGRAGDQIYLASLGLLIEF